MPEFAYIARTAQGESVTGSLSAGSKREALNALFDRSLFPLKLDSAGRKRIRWQLRKRVKADVLASNLTQLADLLHNGVPLLGALNILAEQAAHPVLKEILTDVRDRVVEGTSLDEAFARHPEVFGELIVSMVRAGSEGAFLEDALKRTADFMEMQEDLKSRVAGAMAYPAILATVGSLATVAIVVFLVPMFAELYAQLEKQGGLPTPTVILLWMSNVLGRYGLLILAGLVVLFVWGRKKLRSEWARQIIDRVKLKLPLAGPIFLGLAVSRFCRVLGTLLHNGVPLLRSLEISRDSTGNSILAAAIRNSAQNVSAGDTLSKPLSACGLIPAPVMAMIKVAEESNNLENVLVNIATSIDRKIDRRLDIMVRLVEPAMLLVMGSLILFVLAALLLPVFQMNSTV